MPTKPRSTASATRTPRRKASPTAETCPVLAGFARLKQLESDSAPADVPDPAPIVSPNPPIVSPADPRPTSRSSFGALVLLIVLAISAALVVRHFPGLKTDNDAAIAVRSYAHLCDSEIVAVLRARNDGKLTGEQAADIIQQARPAIHRAAWLRVADRLTALQNQDDPKTPENEDDGLLRQQDLNRFLDEMHSGLSSF